MANVYCQNCNREKNEGENYNPHFCKICPAQKENLAKIEELKKDELTKLGNRHFLKEFLEKYVDKNKPYFVYLFDLDNLHNINREFGYEAGDKYILEFVSLLKNKFRENNVMLFRIGGDEFLAFQLSGDYVEMEEIRKYATFTFSYWYPKEINFYSVLSQLDREIISLKRQREHPIKRFLKKLLGCR